MENYLPKKLVMHILHLHVVKEKLSPELKTEFMDQFASDNSLETRVEVATKIRDRYPDRIPVIVEKAANTNAPDILKKKYLVPQDLTMGKFMFEIRKHMPKLRSEDSIFLFVQKSILPPPYSLISAIYEKHKDVDGFLYITYSGENTFGGDAI